MKKLNLTLLLSALLAGCQLQPRPLPGPVDYPRSTPAGGQMIGKDERPAASSMRVTAIAAPASPAVPQAAEQAPASPQAMIDDEPVSIAIEQTPLPMFVQILYGNVLKRPYTLDPSLAARTDPVTFKTSQPLPKSRVLQLADTLLRNYGLAAQDLGGLVRIAPIGSAVSSAVPAVLREGGSASAGAEQRQVFHHVELSVVRVGEMSQWLKQMLGSRVTLLEDTNQNAFLVSGASGDVRAAIELIRSLDQPRMRGRVARRLTPAYASAQDLATRLTEILSAQGYSAAATATAAVAVLVLPIPSIGSVVVFTTSEQTMEHVVRWARELDQAPQSARSNNALFTYPVRFADAQVLARTLGELLGGTPVAAAPAAQGPVGAGGTQAAAAPQRISGSRVVVNNATNTLIFRGTTAEEQQQIRQLLLELDRPTKSAMIEVVVAELAVGALQRLGVQWTYNGLTGLNASRSATFGGGGLSISYTNTARDILAAIDALATDSQARVLSNPKVMARNGEVATIQVGSEVPIITTQQSVGSGVGPFPGNGGSGVLQQIQYRSTGVILTVRPVINSGNRLDLDVMQEVSSAAATETGVTTTPTISTRRIETKLSLRDGSTVLLGGLISRDSSNSKGGVPLLKDIPLIGAAFRNRSEQLTERELLIMITPYVVNDDFEAEEISAAVQRTFGAWAQDLKTSRVVPQPEQRNEAKLPLPADEVPEEAVPMPAAAPPSGAVLTPPASSPAPAEKTTEGAVISAPSSPAAAANRPVDEGKPKDGKPDVPKPGATKPVEGKKPPAKPEPAGPGASKPVTDPKLLDEFEKHLKKGR